MGTNLRDALRIFGYKNPQRGFLSVFPSLGVPPSPKGYGGQAEAGTPGG